MQSKFNFLVFNYTFDLFWKYVVAQKISLYQVDRIQKPTNSLLLTSFELQF